MQGFTVIDLVILVVYLAAVLFAGLHFSKKEMKGKEFFKGDGTIPWWVTSVSIFATLLSPISFLSLAGNSYAGTWSFPNKRILRNNLCLPACKLLYLDKREKNFLLTDIISDIIIVRN